jgi:hypothetical protein
MKKFIILFLLVTTGLIANAQRTQVKPGDLQKPITDNIAKEWPGYTIKDASKVVANTVTTFEVTVTKGTLQQTLCYDNSGKFVKRIGAAEGKVEQHPAKAVTKTTPPKTQVKK